MTDKKQSVHSKPGSEFLIGGLSAVGAGFITNPIDVIKIRLQLQGELEARGTYKRIYKNTFHTAYMIAKHEGILKLQAGITSALGFQLVLNGIRIGAFETAKNHDWITNKKGNTAIFKTVMVTGIAGCVGAVVASPLYLVKTQMQSQSASAATAVGHQHVHRNTWVALKSLWDMGGMAGLYRGWNANIPRLFVGSATQLTSFSIFSDLLKDYEMFEGRPIFKTFVASFFGGCCVAVTIQPFDVLATRIYNQNTNASGKGSLYNGLLDALIKIFKTEGITGLYKGVFPTWMRITPHTVLCLVFYEEIVQILQRISENGAVIPLQTEKDKMLKVLDKH